MAASARPLRAGGALRAPFGQGWVAEALARSRTSATSVPAISGENSPGRCHGADRTHQFRAGRGLRYVAEAPERSISCTNRLSEKAKARRSSRCCGIAKARGDLDSVEVRQPISRTITSGQGVGPFDTVRASPASPTTSMSLTFLRTHKGPRAPCDDPPQQYANFHVLGSPAIHQAHRSGAP